ncbi:WD40 repeat-containing protein [Phaffia rhodozyma]|uniref:WD40 repeat-containing protein n=1 Tax=Phaffia rhodozyma TaxID=264483 RepID=A0A0F7SGN0_PHARH|nr:WD40 repeat-containing protein [Phaffia rhodozyma]
MAPTASVSMPSSEQPSKRSKQTTRYHERANANASTSAPLALPSDLPQPPTDDSPSFGDLLNAKPALAPLSSSNNATVGSEKTTSLSLARLLTQALHSSDSPLLEKCLGYSDHALVSSTVKKLQPELSVVLLERLGERISLGGGGRGGGASANRVRGAGVWFRCVMREKIGYLVTVPNLLVKLEPIHRVLNERIALNAPLLSLSGRLELALAQIEARQQQQASQAARAAGKSSNGGTYIEGESSDSSSSDEESGSEEEGEDVGEMEDVGFGIGSDEDEDDSEDEDDEDDEDAEDDEDNESIEDSDAEVVRNATLVDDEASEEGSEAGDEDDDLSE